MGRVVVSWAVLGLVWATCAFGQVVPGDPGLCSPSWIPTFGGPTDLPGTNGEVLALAELPDGTTNSLVVGGAFTTAGGSAVLNIAEQRGVQWSPMGDGLDGAVRALCVYDEGSGPMLFAGGDFTHSGSTLVSHIARWDGQEWTPVSAGVNGIVRAMTVFDDPQTGEPVLYAAGSFNVASGVPASKIARWNGTSWAPVGPTIDAAVRALTVFDDGSGPKLVAGGSFTFVDGQPINRVAIIDGTTWSSLGAAVEDGNVLALAAFNSGAGERLIVGGNFNQVAGQNLGRVVQWDGSSWSTMGSGLSGGAVRALAVAHDAELGPALYAGGTFTNKSRVARWGGFSWQDLESGVSNGTVEALLVHQPAASLEHQLVAGGDFTAASGEDVQDVARWVAGSWQPVGGGLSDGVTALHGHYFNGVSSLYAGGQFEQAGGLDAPYIARWDGVRWDAVGAGVSGGVVAMESFQGDLIVGGNFLEAGGQVVNRIAAWTGSAWEALSAGVNGSVLTLLAHDDGRGDGVSLYAGGIFSTASGVPVNGIGRWDGSSWHPLADAGNAGATFALAEFDDGLGAGPRLIAGGNFSLMGGVPVSRVAAWNGSTWESLGAGTNAAVTCFAAFDDGLGSGPALFVGGVFTEAGGEVVNRLGRWDGTTWSAVGSGPTVGLNGTVDCLDVYDDGSGPALYVGGDFTEAGGVSAPNIARWDGASWSPVGSGLSSRPTVMLGYDDHLGAGTSLYVGGQFSVAPDSGDGYLARWGGCGDPGPGWTVLGDSLAGVSGPPSLTAIGTLAPGSSNALVLANAAPTATTGVVVSLSSTPAPFKGGTLVPFPILVLVVLATDVGGTLGVGFGMPPGVNEGTEMWVQCAVQDAAAVAGVALSNAVLGVTP